MRYTIALWAATLRDVAPGEYDLRCRTVDLAGNAQADATAVCQVRAQWDSESVARRGSVSALPPSPKRLPFTNVRAASLPSTFSPAMKHLFLLGFAIATPIAAALADLRTYAPDANTLHLWHLDEPNAPAIDAGSDRLDLSVLANGAIMGNPSLPGYGTALSTFDSGLTGGPADAYLSAFTLVNGAGDETTLIYRNLATGAFTFEALIRLDVDLTQTFAGTVRRTARCMFLAAKAK